MPRAAKSPPNATPAINAGDDAEIRVAQVWFWDGLFARRGVNLERHYQAETVQVTDLDLLAIELGPTLEPRRFIGESKTGMGKSAPKPLDRVIWLRGLMDLLGGVDGAELTSARRPATNLIELGAPLHVLFQSLDDLARREVRLHIDRLGDFGSQGPGAFVATAAAQAVCRNDAELDRAFWFLRSEVWFLDPWMAIKRLMSVIGVISRRWAPRLNDEEQSAIRWLLAEAVSVFALQMCVVGGFALRVSPREYMSVVANKLADPGVDARRMRQLSEAIDRYLVGVLSRANAPRSLVVESMGAFSPTPPAYADALAETARRLSVRVDVARALPRYMDLVIHERLVRGRHVDPQLVRELDGADPVLLARAARLIGVFLVGQAGLPDAVLELFAAEQPLPATREQSHADPAASAVPEVAGPPSSDGSSRPVSKDEHAEARANESAAALPADGPPGVRISLTPEGDAGSGGGATERPELWSVSSKMQAEAEAAPAAPTAPIEGSETEVGTPDAGE